MSAYLYFFLRGKDDKFYTINSFSRSTTMYGLCNNFAPWESIRRMTKEDIFNVVADIRNSIDHSKSMIKDVIDTIEIVKECNNSIEDKVSVIDEYLSNKKDLEEMLEEYNEARYFFSFLEDMIDEAEYSDIDCENYIYCGIEISSPTVKDIKE